MLRGKSYLHYIHPENSRFFAHVTSSSEKTACKALHDVTTTPDDSSFYIIHGVSRWSEYIIVEDQQRRLRVLLGHLKMEGPTEMSSNKMFGGFNRRYKHYSPTLACDMTFSIFFPPASVSKKVPVLYWLSGLTCTDENFIAKSGAQRAASKESVALVAPDTSPRGLNVEGESDSWDFGVGAGFYLNATQEKWGNWRMYDYVVDELPKLLSSHFHQLDTSNASIFGHSMGGHGALTVFFKNQNKYKSVSAFAPIVNPIDCPWGQKAFLNYLGDDKSSWEEYDATYLVKKCNGLSKGILIDQGDEDKFLHNQLLPHKFEEACKIANVPLTLRLQPGYDHSYFFIATFIDEHIEHHSKALHAL